MRKSLNVRGLCLISLAALVVTLSTSIVYAQRELKDIPDPDPELERKSFIVADGFEVSLFAADPRIAKPIQMNFDAQGRLWIASSSIYPQILPGQVADDRILVIEDVDRDGVADKTTVFVDGLLIPTGIEPGDGGAYVANSTELVHFKDTNGDGTADERRVMLSGFGTEDTHHILHTFRWGMDGMLYFNQSIYIHSHIETPLGVRRLNGGGIWQFRPETMHLDVLMRGLVNTWGHQQDDWGQSFATDGAGGEGINYVFPGSAFLTAVGYPRVMKGLNPGSPKYCGMEIVGGRHLPDDWQGNILTNDFRGHRVCRFVMSDDGSGFAAREQGELIKTTHVAFRPIDIKMGPDGAIYIADWYNPIIQHGEVDFRDPRRDLTRGRIWRVTAKGRSALPYPKLIGASTAELLQSLAAPEQFTRHHAKRQLKERGSAIVPELAKWVQELDPQNPQFEHLRLEGLWTYQSLDVPEPNLLISILNSPDPRARSAAVRVVPFWQNSLPNPMALLTSRVTDEHPRVRLEAVRALASFRTLRALELAMLALDRPVDKNIDYALWLTARELQGEWLPQLQAGTFDFDGNTRYLTFVLQAAGSPAVVKPLLESMRKGQIAPERASGVLKLVGALGDSEDLNALFEIALKTPSAGTLELLESAARFRAIKPAGDLNRLGSLLELPDREVRMSAARLAGLWKVEMLRTKLTEWLTSPANGPIDPELKIAAWQGLVGLGSEIGRLEFTRLAGIEQTADVRVLAVAGLAALDSKSAGTMAIDVLRSTAGKADPAPIFRAFLEQKDGPAVLTAALTDQPIPEDIAKIGIRILRRGLREETELLNALQKSGNIQTGIRALTSEEMLSMVADVSKIGNAQRGEAIFRRKETICFRCHAIGGAGGQVGPDLVSVGASAQIDYLVDSLLNPNKQIKEGYHSLIVVNDQGKVFNGIKISETDQDLVLRNSEDQEVAIPVASIDERINGTSLMPVGLADDLTRSELIDLVRFLSELGKVGPYSVGKSRLVRRWQILSPVSNVTEDWRGKTTEELISQPSLPWASIYSTVAGSLPMSDVTSYPAVGKANAQLLRVELEATSPGQIQLQMKSVENLRIWIDGNSVTPSALLTLNLMLGTHHLILESTRSAETAPLSLELTDVDNSTAQVQIINGK